MALPASLIPVFKTKRFWTDYHWFTTPASRNPYKGPFRNAQNVILNPEDDELPESGPSQRDTFRPDDTDHTEQSEDDESDGEPDEEIELSIPISWSAFLEPKGSGGATSCHAAVESSTTGNQDKKASNDEGDKEDGKLNEVPNHWSPYPPYRLTLAIDSDFDYILLGYSTPNLARENGPDNPFKLGHDDQAHWYPYALRWSELELFSRAVVAASLTAEKPSQRRWATVPGLTILLLTRFAPICRNTYFDENVNHDPAAEMQKVVRLIVSAFWQVFGRDRFDDKTIRRFIERQDFRRDKFRWFRHKNTGNWWIGCGDDPETAEDVYTSRSEGSVGENGNWNQAEWDRLLAAARRAVEEQAAVLQDIPDPTANVSDDELMSRFGPRDWIKYKIHLPLTKRDRPLHQDVSSYFKLCLDGILRVLDIGTAEATGSGSTFVDGHQIWTDCWYSVAMCWPETRNRALLKQSLWWLRAPLAAMVSEDTYSSRKSDTKSFSLDNDKEDIPGPGELYLAIYSPAILPSFLASQTLPDTLPDALTSPEVLGDDGHVSGPTDGWYTVTAPDDDGELGLYLSLPNQDEALERTGALALRKVTPKVTDILHRFMAATGVALGPVALVATPLPQNIRNHDHCLDHCVVDAEALYEILSGGPYKLWLQSDKRSGPDKELDHQMDLANSEIRHNPGW
jgi:hypothetical protein